MQKTKGCLSCYMVTKQVTWASQADCQQDSLKSEAFYRGKGRNPTNVTGVFIYLYGIPFNQLHYNPYIFFKEDNPSIQVIYYICTCWTHFDKKMYSGLHGTTYQNNELTL